jgi:hypothetical protein
MDIILLELDSPVLGQLVDLRVIDTVGALVFDKMTSRNVAQSIPYCLQQSHHYFLIDIGYIKNKCWELGKLERRARTVKKMCWKL